VTGRPPFTSTQLWRDATRIPDVVAATLDRREGFADVLALLSAPNTRRVVVTGNGAAYYVGLALWTASVAGPAGPEVLAVPAGLLASGDLAWRPGDVVLVVSSSGELRDVVELLPASGLPRPFAAVTATPGSSIGRAADAVAVTQVEGTSGATHTQSLMGNHAVVAALWAELTGDGGLRDAVAAAPELCAAALAQATAWCGETLAELALPAAATTFGSGPAWPAALEAALLLKEVAGVPAEGMETREGATSGMYALRPGHLAVGLPLAADTRAAEALAVCRRTGAAVLALPGGALGDRRLASLTTFPAALPRSRPGRPGGDRRGRPFLGRHLLRHRARRPQPLSVRQGAVRARRPRPRPRRPWPPPASRGRRARSPPPARAPAAGAGGPRPGAARAGSPRRPPPLRR
jgi:glutamine---fructose-6-phosphate transaminase (isomerizing)